MPDIRQKNGETLSAQVRGFVKREYVAVLLSASLGAICAGLLKLFLSDHAFDSLLISRYLPPTKTFDDPSRYIPYGLVVGFTIILVFAIQLPKILVRGVKSWWFGVTSGLWFLPFVLTLAALSATEYSFRYRVLAGLAGIGVSIVLGALCHCRAIKRSRHIPDEKDIEVSTTVKNAAGTALTESDDPIRSWSEDSLDRAGLIDSLSVKLLIAKAPVIALFGEFGSGKTSILNLLREHLDDKAIVVSFSTWLPGSQETLTSYLMADIANECQKQYMVPGLRKSAGRLANALAQTVPFLKGFPELFPAATQRDDIENLKIALMRLPKRVVVLLDELDRMQRDELLPLLKVVRGISALPNLSFVCAAERKTLTETVCGDNKDDSNLYFEKFFPASVAVPKEDLASLQKAGVDRLISALRRRSWFENETDVDDFRKELEEVWSLRIAPFLRNLRAVGLLANDVGVAAAPLRRQVDPIDLTLIEMLRRFKPAVYDIVAKNSLILTGGDNWLRGGDYRSDDEKKRGKARFFEDLKTATEGEAQLEQIKGILGEMFPKIAAEDRFSWDLRPKRKNKEDDERRISEAGMFPAYFRYDLPAAIYSAVELETFIKNSADAADDAARRKLFSDELSSMEKGSLKRDDFLRKVSNVVTKVSIPVGQAWVDAAMLEAKNLTYDRMMGFGEAGHIFRMVFRVAEELPKASRVAFLDKCIADATDDSMSFWILTRSTSEENSYKLQVSFADLYPSFIRRMRTRYGRDVDVAHVDITTGDPGSFNLWGMQPNPKYNVTADPEDRLIQYDFWRRYIGNSRLRLLQSFAGIFLPQGLVEGPTDPYVENKLDVATIRRLNEQLPHDEPLTDYERQAQRKLQRFLNGDFKNGIGFENIDDPGDSIEETVGAIPDENPATQESQ
jgi:KAP family P-loop domain